MCEHVGPEDLTYWLDPAHWEGFKGYLRRKFVSLSKEDIDDVLAQAEAELLEKPPKNKNGSNESLEGFVFTIVKRRARDLIRRADTRGRTLKKCQEKTRAEAGPEGEANAQNAYDPLELAELQEHVIEAFDELNPDQWLVLSVYCEEYPDVRGPTRLLKALVKQAPEVSKRNWTPAIVRRLLNRARAIVRRELRNKGYEL